MSRTHLWGAEPGRALCGDLAEKFRGKPTCAACAQLASERTAQRAAARAAAARAKISFGHVDLARAMRTWRLDEHAVADLLHVPLEVVSTWLGEKVKQIPVKHAERLLQIFDRWEKGSSSPGRDVQRARGWAEAARARARTSDRQTIAKEVKKLKRVRGEPQAGGWVHRPFGGKTPGSHSSSS